MENSSFFAQLKKLPLLKKIIGSGAFLLIVSSFLPWYQDIDKFRTGDMFLGVTGPLYLAGFLVLIAGAVSLTVIVYNILEKPLPKLPITERQIHIFGASLSLLLLLIVSSVYFHPKFGINISDKTAGVGMIGAFVSGFLMLGAGIYSIKMSGSSNSKKHMETLMDMGLEERPKGEVRQDTTVPINLQNDPDSLSDRPRDAYTGNSGKMSAGGFRTPFQQSIPDSYFSKKAFENSEKENF